MVLNRIGTDHCRPYGQDNAVAQLDKGVLYLNGHSKCSIDKGFEEPVQQQRVALYHDNACSRSVECPSREGKQFPVEGTVLLYVISAFVVSAACHQCI